MTRYAWILGGCAAMLGLVGCEPPREPQPQSTRASGEAVIDVDLSTRHQTIDGFGTCLTDWRPQFHELYATDAFRRTYAETVGCSMLRIFIWSLTLPEPVDDWRDIRYQDFTLEGKAYPARSFLEFARGIREINPDIKVIGTVWSPPPWMKINERFKGTRADAINAVSYTRDGRTFDNRLKPEMVNHYARWLVEMVKLHEAEGVPLDGLSIGNEVMFTQTFASCVWTAGDYAAMVKRVGRMLEEAGLGHVELYGPETMTGHDWPNRQYIDALMNDPETARHFDVFATHGFTKGFGLDPADKPSWRYRQMIEPHDRRFWITEGGTGGHDWPTPLLVMGSQFHNALTAGNVSAITNWQITDVEPNTHGLMVFDQMTPKTHVATQFYRFIRPGAVRVEASPADGEVAASAYHHRGQKTLTMVLLNPRQTQRQVTLNLGDDARLAGLHEMRAYRTSAEEAVAELEPIAVERGRATLTMPAHSIVTLQGDLQ